MSLSKWWRSVWDHRRRSLLEPVRRQQPAKRFHPQVEYLEDRLAPSTSTTFVDDNWQDISRTTGAPQIGDIIQNTNDTINPGGIIAGYGITGFGTTNLGTAAGAATINDAITNTNAGGTINVLEGTYSEKVEVSKALTILGAQHGVDARTGRPGAAESVLDATGNSGQTLFDVTASNVTIDGFTVENETSANVFGAGIRLAPGTSGSHILNDIIENNLVGLFLANNSSTAQTVIQDDLFLNNNNNPSGPLSGTAIYTDQFVSGTTLTNILIDSNVFSGNNNGGVLLGSTQAGTQSNITISDSTFTGNGNAVFVGDATSVSLFRNTITASTASQIAVVGGVNGLSIMQNFIDNGATSGVRVLIDTGDGFAGANQNITLTSNHIQGNPTSGLNLDSGAYTGTLNATNNFWGSPTGPTTPRNPGGTGDKIIDPDSVVVFSPFLNNGADAQPNTPGFQPSPNLPPPPSPILPPPSVSVAFGPFGEVLELVSPNGTLIQFDATGPHVLGGGVRAASVAFGPGGEELLVTFQNGALALFDAAGAHPLASSGVLSASLAFGPQGPVTEVVLLNGSLSQFDSTGGHFLGGGVSSTSVAFTAGSEELLVTFQSGALILFDPAGAHVLATSGVQSANLTFDATGAAVVDVITQDGTLTQFDSAGVHVLGRVS